MRISKYLLIGCLAIWTLTFTSCNNKNTPIHDLEELSEDLKQNSKDYSMMTGLPFRKASTTSTTR